jgi:restriction system protein
LPSQYPYRETVRNEYLGVTKIIRAMTADELRWLADTQIAKWDEQEIRKRQLKQKEADREVSRQHTEDLKLQAEEDSKAAKQRLDAFGTVLNASLADNLAIDWDQLLDRRSCRPFKFSHQKPDRESIRISLLGPEPTERGVPEPVFESIGLLEFVLPFLRTRRLERDGEMLAHFQREKKNAAIEYEKKLRAYRAGERDVLEAFNSEVRSYNDLLKKEKQKYTRERDEFVAHQKAHNDAVLAFRSRYEGGSAEAVERYLQMVLERSSYPEGITGEPDVKFDDPSKTVVVNWWLPTIADVPNIVEHKYVSSRKAIKPVEMKQKEFEAFFEDVIHQIVLRTIREVFVADYASVVEAVVFNGWVRGIDRKTGTPFTSCVLSCEAARKQFLTLDLAHVSPKECVRGLKGITAGPLAMLAPVQPIMDLKRDDVRFVEPKQVLEHLRAEDNLAAMDWEDFEHLVRELFEKEFNKSGGEVRITQASRDRGVDAIAFDPDPIRGGKFVIQAKRYNMVVPVSAVRDLYGTIIAEGATKGILVTTSHYGRDSREFAKDKPIMLIDGPNLVHMFQKYGHDVHITILPKGDPRRGLG